jgi:hypothetical protein
MKRKVKEVESSGILDKVLDGTPLEVKKEVTIMGAIIANLKLIGIVTCDFKEVFTRADYYNLEKEIPEGETQPVDLYCCDDFMLVRAPKEFFKWLYKDDPNPFDERPLSKEFQMKSEILHDYYGYDRLPVFFSEELNDMIFRFKNEYLTFEAFKTMLGKMEDEEAEAFASYLNEDDEEV